MPEPFKNIYNPNLIRAMAAHLGKWSGFDSDAFLSKALTGIDTLEMMQRAEQISCALDIAFGQDFEKNVNGLKSALHPTTKWRLSDMRVDDQGIAGWAIVPMAAYVARNGLDRPELSLPVLREMTMRFSAEFAIRPFFRDHPATTLDIVRGWLTDPNVHVRRLVSEGSRPRLPWGIRLNAFVENPAPLLPLLNALRDDPEEYVRRSVANNLNDIAKDHPDLVAELARDWLDGADRSRTRLIKHACRTLIKAGHPDALTAFGFPPPDLQNVHLALSPDTVILGDDLILTLNLTGGRVKQRLLIDYVLEFRRARGGCNPKVFKWTEIDLAPGETRRLEKVHAYRKVTTRKDYPGAQRVLIQINGRIVAEVPFELRLARTK